MNRLSALAVSIALAVPGAAFARPVDPGFSVPQPTVDPGFSVQEPQPGVDPGFSVQEPQPGVDPGFGVQEPRPINVLRRNGINPIARILFFPLLPFVEAQARLSPEKASCWNDGATEVAGCSVVKQIETAKERRGERREARPTPTPYGL